MHRHAPDTLTLEIAQAAAAIICDEGLHWRAAMERGARAMGLSAAQLRRAALPDAALLDAAVREHIALFCPEQGRQLHALREIALQWMRRFAAFAPLVGGSVWHGTATKYHDVFIAVFSDDEKAVEIALIDAGADFAPSLQVGLRGREHEALSAVHICRGEHARIVGDAVAVHVMVYAENEMRGALLPDKMGRKPRGNIQELEKLLNGEI